MRVYLIALTCLLVFIACDDWTPIYNTTDGGIPIISDLKCSPLPDLTTPTAKCTAAKGLAGDNLLCVDFSQVSSLVDQKLTGWFFGKDTMSMDCWELAGGKLQIKNFGQFASTCGLTLPSINLNDADKQKYQSVTLSVIQRVDINNPNQTAQAALGSSLPNRTFWSTTGKTEHQQLMISMARSDAVPMAASQVYQYLLQLTSGVMAGGTAQGWQIESIAVNASP